MTLSTCGSSTGVDSPLDSGLSTDGWIFHLIVHWIALLCELMRNCDTVPLMVLMQSAEMHAAGDSCVIAALQRMEAANKGMLREGIIHVIA